MTTLIDPPHHEARAPTRRMQTNNHIGPTPIRERVRPVCPDHPGGKEDGSWTRP